MQKLKTIAVAFLFLFSLLFVVFNVSQVHAISTSYYVSNSGNDGNTGLSDAQAWKTIAKVNTELNGGVINTGDDIYFNRDDTFTDTYLNIKTGGSSTDIMVIGAYGTGDKPRINGTTYGILMITANVNYVTMQDMTLSNTTSDTIIIYWNHTDINLKNIDVFDSGHNGIFINQTVNFTIENCNFINNDFGGVILYGSKYHPISNGRILNTTSINGGADDAFTTHSSDGTPSYDTGSNFYFKNCTGAGFDEQAFDITSGENIILLDCEGYGNGDSSILIGGTKNVTIDNFYSHDETTNADTCGIILGVSFVGVGNNNTIIRNSKICNIRYHAISIESGTTNLSFYNNDVVYGPGTTGVNGILVDISGGDTLVFKNNIFFSFKYDLPATSWIRYLLTNLSNTDSAWINNVWWRGDGGTTGDERWWDIWGSNKGWATWQGYPQTFGELRVDPLIDDPVNGSFIIDAASPCIDAGAWLTQTNGGNTGTVITVDNASYFMDGYGLTDGDNIFVGDDYSLEIIDVNYKTNQITVDRSITWVDNDNVSLSSYYGDKPDIGATEYLPSSININIPSDSGFNIYNGVRYGSGTAANPYVISNWSIFNISISGTTKNITIYNCTIIYHALISGLSATSNLLFDTVTMDGAGHIPLSYIYLTHTQTTFTNSKFYNLSYSYMKNG